MYLRALASGMACDQSISNSFVLPIYSPLPMYHQGDSGGPDSKSILQQQNHELAVDMRRRKRQEAELEKKLAQAWARQGHFDATLSAVNRAWRQVGLGHGWGGSWWEAFVFPWCAWIAFVFFSMLEADRLD